MSNTISSLTFDHDAVISSYADERLTTVAAFDAQTAIVLSFNLAVRFI